MGFPRYFSRIFDIREKELERVIPLFAYLLLIIACYTTTKAVRDSLFVTKIGPGQLPYMYLLIAGVMGIVSYVYSKAIVRIGLYRLMRATSLISISSLLMFWWASDRSSSVWFYALYVWVSLFGAITASQLWLLATHVFDAREARRVFTWIASGGIVGGIVGGALTRVAATRSGTESLLLVCAAMMAATIVFLERVARRSRTEIGEEGASKPREPDAAGGSALFKEVRKSRHLSMLVIVLIVAVVVEAFVDYEYKFVAKQAFSSKDQLTAFFGTVTFYIGIFSLLFQLLLANRVLKHFGVGGAILLLPVCLLAGSLILAFRPGLWAAAFLQLIDGGFSYSIHRSGTELLYLPVPPQIRNAVKGFIDMFVDRMGRAVGGLLLLLLTAVLTLSIPWLSAVASCFLIVWIGAAIAVRQEYLHAFRLALERKAIEPEASQIQALDKRTVATLLKTLSGDDERGILYALDLLSNTHPDRWRSHIPGLIQHSSSPVRARTIAILAQWLDPAVTQDQFINHPDYETARIAAASALSFQWTGTLRESKRLDQFLNNSSHEVVRHAIRTAANVRYEDAIPVLIEKLADKHLRSEAREALLRFGTAGRRELVRQLSDEKRPIAVRTRIPKVLAYTGKQEAAQVLADCLSRPGYDLEHPILKALNIMRTRSDQIQIGRECVAAAIASKQQEYDNLCGVLNRLQVDAPDSPQDADKGAAASHALLVRAIGERLDEKTERIFRLLALIYPPRDVYSAYYNCNVKPALRASAIEFLDNILDGELKTSVIPLVEEAFDSERHPRREGVKFISREAALKTLMEGEDRWLQVIAADLAGKIPGSEPADIPGEDNDRHRQADTG